MNRIEVGDLVRVNTGYELALGKVICVLREDDGTSDIIMAIMPDGSAWEGPVDSPDLLTYLH